jgi:hypothetical protein
VSDCILAFVPAFRLLIVNLKIENPNGVLHDPLVISTKSSTCPSMGTAVTLDRNTNRTVPPTDPMECNSPASEPVIDAAVVSTKAEIANDSETRPTSIEVSDSLRFNPLGTENSSPLTEIPVADFAVASAQAVDRPGEAISATSPADLASSPQDYQSWIFRVGGVLGDWVKKCFGTASLIGCLAVATSIPGLQILTLGYLIESSGRVGRTGKVRSGLPGLNRAADLGSRVLGTWVLLLPLFYISSLVEAARLIEPTSRTVVSLRLLQSFLLLIILPHLITAWFCGGKLRYFFWPLLAPYQLSIWALRWMLTTRPLRSILDETLGQLWPALVNDLCLVRPLTDFFVPAILIKHLWQGTLYRQARDGFWSFLGGLHLLHLTRLGLQALAGSVAWLFVPTLLLIGGTLLPSGPAVLSGLLGIFTLSVVSMYLPLLQTHFGTLGQMHALFDGVAVFRLIGKSPLRITMSSVLFLAAALPLYALKIEQIDASLTWILGLVFILFSLPSRLLVAWSYARADRCKAKTRWFWRWPIRSVMWPAALFFSGFVSITRFTSWGGAAGLFEHHAFLIPAPFLQWFS